TVPQEGVQLVCYQTGAEWPRRGEPELRGRPQVEQSNVESERLCRAPRELRARKDLRTRRVEGPARRVVHELHDHTGEVCRRRRRDELVRGNPHGCLARRRSISWHTKLVR